MARKTIVIDIGHGGKDPGTSGKGMLEKKVNYNVGMELKRLLSAKGFNVICTREVDKYLSLPARGRIATANKADFMISVHHNGAANPKAAGYDVIYESNKATNAQSKKMALLIANEFKKLGQKEHRAFSRPYKNTGEDYYTVMSSTRVPVVITEYAFMTSPEDVAKIDTFTEQWAEAAAIARAVCRYFGVEVY